MLVTRAVITHNYNVSLPTGILQTIECRSTYSTDTCRERFHDQFSHGDFFRHIM